MNRAALFDWANAMGLTYFMAYALGVQKIIYRALRRNTLGTLATYSAGSMINPYDRLGILNTVPKQNFVEKNCEYATDPANVVSNYQAHYVNQLLHSLF